jgi:hypothetical protein
LRSGSCIPTSIFAIGGCEIYSPDIIDRRLAAAKKAGIPFRRCSRDESIETAARLQKLIYDARGNKLPWGTLARPLDAKESAHILSEQTLCKFDFSYYGERFHVMSLDTGTVDDDVPVAPIKFQESQRRLIKSIGKREEEVHAEYAKYKMTEGIRVIAHKTRQQYYTAICRALTLHRMLLWPGTRAFAGALNPDGQGELYKRDKLAIENLPWWMRPEIAPDVKDTEIGFTHPLSCRLLYQSANQKQGMGVGSTIDVSHLTEVPLYMNPSYDINFSLLPAIPKARSTLHIQEGTSAGPAGYWREVSEACRNKEEGYASWTYVFIPWYFNSKKYRRIPPPNWTPSAHTLEHAELIERTSADWNDGVTVRATIEQLVWWQSEREMYSKQGSLGKFLASYPATPEQSFTQWGDGALPTELLERMELDERRPHIYDVEVAVTT